MQYEWNAVGPHFGHLRPDQITTDTCRAYTEKRRRAGKHDGTIWTELGHLRTVFTWAKGARLIEHAPPVERPQKPAPRDRYLTRQEAKQLREASSGHIKTAIALLLTTAARVSAILQLRWDRVDFERGQIDLRVSDIGPRKGRAIVPMNNLARETLLAAREAALSEFVVEWAGGPVASIKTGFNRAVKDAGLKGVTPHVLRHTAAVHMVEAGVPIEEVAQYLGHTSPSVTFRIYGRFSPTHLRKAAAALEF
jgi:integrase